MPIKINKKQDCCGCNACTQVCPKNCISMHEDEQGFLYPKVDLDLCIGCELCTKVCPVINQSEQRLPISVLAAKNKNEEIRLKSSSGGIFTLLAEYIIKRGGVVFGAKFDKDWNVVHDYTETLEGLSQFRGSKYVQSRIGNSFKKVKEFLKNERLVLFTGTPCQIAGLKHYLRKEYDKLIIVDVACHGVPSPMVWRDYIKYIGNKKQLEYVSFRDKATGWKKYSTCYKYNNRIISKFYFDDIYMRVFLRNLCLRPSCYECPSKGGKSGSDITVADFWGIQDIHPEIDDDKGISLVLINSEKGQQIYSELETETTKCKYEDAVKYNPSIERSVGIPRYYNMFWEKYEQYGITSVPATLKKVCHISLKRRLKIKLYSIYSKLLRK